ncbi:UDP-glucuronosyl/UDP-glucosyltransferase [Macleaya cordata]|uniref:Glycosyltransferase n=1 Tax=Macleaya cordata TaxID=56857 RepID=A0A200QZP8_MACCD|nr:UDP-glucuronosyl/UDP-glucosyltransferase [Macleaya cordata]
MEPPKSLLHHVLMVSFPGQGHINPLLRLAKCLASKGLLVTFSTTQQTGQMMKEATNKTDDTTSNIGDGQLRFEFFSDGWDIDEPKRASLDAWMHQLETAGRDSFIQLINQHAEQGRPVSCIINNPFVPWVTDVATELGIPSAVLWVQSCAVYSIYYHYHHQLVSFPNPDQQDLTLDLPGLPTLDFQDIPSFLTLNPFDSLKQVILAQFKNLEKAFCVLVDSFEELESETISAMSHLAAPIRPVGPLFKSQNDVKVRGDMWKAADDCLRWLDSKSPGSVVYVSFGSIVALPKEQMEELGSGLLNSGLPFLWVVKPPPKELGIGSGLPDGFVEEAEDKGSVVVEWSPQEQVLDHPSVACFVTHCGWNSSMESLSSGVPVVAFPQWGDQVTNAKFLVDVYGVGLRMKKCTKKDQELVTSEEVERCIVEVTKGLKAEELKKNALKWKKAAEEAVAEGGSSYRNIQSFVDDIKRMAC